MIRPATRPRDDEASTRLLVVEGTRIAARTIRDLPALLSPGDLLVVNDAATLPASLAAVGPRGEPLEARLLSVDADAGRLEVVLFGAGDHRTRTEDRPAPPRVRWLRAGALRAAVHASDEHARRATLVCDLRGDALVRALYAHGRPIQYAHVPELLPLWAVQTPYASRPWSVEMPSAGRPLTAGTLLALARRGIAVARITHAAGPSSTGDAQMDARLPLPERYSIPDETVRAIASAARVIAVGTSVVRALEDSAARYGRVRAGEATATLRLDERTRRAVVCAVLTGVHDPGTSHRELLASFAPPERLDEAFAVAEAHEMLGHELGDAMLVWASRRWARAVAA